MTLEERLKKFKTKEDEIEAREVAEENYDTFDDDEYTRLLTIRQTKKKKEVQQNTHNTHIP